ncbi:MAG: TonB family protein [Acidobacteria bacterium]|nr:TonB family protein [Acidobacteriota bacterium]
MDGSINFVTIHVIQPKVLRAIAPQYPCVAAAAGSTGIVTIEVMISSSGKVTSAKVLGGPPLLRDSALQAARMWVFDKASDQDERSNRLYFTYVIISTNTPVEPEVVEFIAQNEIIIKADLENRCARQQLKARPRPAGRTIEISTYTVSSRKDFHVIKAFLQDVVKNKGKSGKQLFYLSRDSENLDISIFGDLGISNNAYAYWPANKAVIIMDLRMIASDPEWMERKGYINLETQVVSRNVNLGCCLYNKNRIRNVINKCLRGEKVFVGM